MVIDGLYMAKDLYNAVMTCHCTACTNNKDRDRDNFESDEQNVTEDLNHNDKLFSY